MIEPSHDNQRLELPIVIELSRHQKSLTARFDGIMLLHLWMHDLFKTKLQLTICGVE